MVEDSRPTGRSRWRLGNKLFKVANDHHNLTLVALEMFKVEGIGYVEDWLVRCWRVNFEMTFGSDSVTAVATIERLKDLGFLVRQL